MNSQVTLRVYLDSTHERFVDVPVTSDTQCSDVIAMCAEPGQENYYLAELWRGCERPVEMEEKPYEMLQHWGAHRHEVRFYLRHGATQHHDRRSRKGRNGLREEEDSNHLPSGVDLTLSELQDMATRQQRQIEEQQQMLVAKEQRLKFLKQQEARHQQVANENERLRRLREKVEAQELKLKKLRALRGHVTEQKQGNNTLSSELEQIKALFNEKEKELSLAVHKVEDLTRQLDELRNGRVNGLTPGGEHNNNSPAFLELDKLRKELMLRNKLNEQQSSRIAAHREILSTRQLEVQRMDARIAELQLRLRNKKQLHSDKLANHKPLNNSSNYSNSNLSNQKPSNTSINYGGNSNLVNQNMDKKPLRTVNSYGNEAYHAQRNIVEPKVPGQFVDNTKQQMPQVPYSSYQQGPNKQDTKYQTLPHSIKFPGGQDVSKSSQPHVPASAHGHTSTVSSLAPRHEHIDTSQKNISRNVSPRPTVSSAAAASSVPKPYGTYTSASLPAPISVTSSVTMVTHASPSIVYSTSGVRTSSPKTSTPMQSNPDPESRREIFITGAPVVSSTTSDKPTNHIGTSKPISSGIPNAPGSKPASPLYRVSPVSRPGQPANVPNAQTLSSHVPDSPRARAPAPNSDSSPRALPPRTENSSPRVPPQSNIPPQTNDPRYPPPYNYPHHRKTGSAPVSTKSESASSLPQPPATGKEDSKVLSRQANSDSQLLTSTDPSISSALSVLKSGPMTSQTSSQNATGNRPRFATRSAIANTYTNKLSSSAMDQYRKNMSMLYADMSAEGAERAESPTARVQPMVYDPSTATGRDEQASPAPEVTNQNPPSAQTFPGHNQSAAKVDQLSNGPQSLGLNLAAQDFERERAKLRPNAPRPLRRRLSSGGDSPIAAARMVVEKNEARGMFYEEQQTSFSTQDDPNKSPSPSSVHSHSDTSPTPIVQPPSGQVLDPPDLIRVDVIQKESMMDDVNANKNTDSNSKLGNTYGVENIPYADEDSLKQGDSPVKGQTQIIETTKSSTKGIFLKRGKRPRRNVTFDPLALLLDAALEGELDLVVKSAHAVSDPSEPNDEGITALHNAICAGHYDIVKFLVEYGCNVNAPDSDGWTPLHCAASCNNLPMVRILVENGACIFATTISDEETAAEKCEEDEEGYHGCSEYLYSIQEKLGIANKGAVYAVFDYTAERKDELSFENGQSLTVLRKGDKSERQWWWARRGKTEGYIPCNLLGMYPRVIPKWLSDINKKS